jgi:hypothetical protein
MNEKCGRRCSSGWVAAMPHLCHHVFLKLLPAEARLYSHNQQHINYSLSSGNVMKNNPSCEFKSIDDV